jgi:hypothetical protein
MASIYIIFDERPAGEGFSIGFTSMQGVSDFTNIKYDNLLYHFTRKHKRWHYFKNQGVKVIRVDSINKGPQRVYKRRMGHNRNI